MKATGMREENSKGMEKTLALMVVTLDSSKMVIDMAKVKSSIVMEQHKRDCFT